MIIFRLKEKQFYETLISIWVIKKQGRNALVHKKSNKTICWSAQNCKKENEK